VGDVTPWRDGLELACAHDVFGLTVADVADRVKSGHYIAAAIGDRGLAVLELLDVRGSKTLTVAALCGIECGVWLADLLAFLDRLAVDQGCTQILAWGRPGWDRVLRGHGYRRRVTGLIREVTA
jgi:hypothetical protein